VAEHPLPAEGLNSLQGGRWLNHVREIKQQRTGPNPTLYAELSRHSDNKAIVKALTRSLRFCRI